jgi:hypothetical protein
LHFVFAGDGFEGGDVFADGGALERVQALRGDAQGVTERQSDAFLT